MKRFASPMRLRKELAVKARLLLKRLNRINRGSEIETAIRKFGIPIGEMQSCDHRFILVFCAVRFLLQDRKELAQTVLSACGTDAFVSELRLFIDKHVLPASFSPLFESSRSVEIWSRVTINKKFNSNSLKVLGSLLKPKIGDCGRIVVVDIGTGDGVFIQEVLEMMARRQKTTVTELILYDVSTTLLKVACERFDSPCCPRIDSIVAFAKNIRQLNKDDQVMIGKLKPTFALSAACLHHLMAHEKLRFFKWIKGLGIRLIVMELEANHDRPRRGSPELVFSVYRFYRFLLEALDESEMAEKDRLLCKQEFIFSEAMQILTRSRVERQNYHTFAEDWEFLARRAGLRIAACKTVSLGVEKPRQLIMDFRAC